MEANIKWPKADLKSMRIQMERATTQLGKPFEVAVNMAAFYLARSAAARTKTAPKKRRAYVNREKTGMFNNHRFPYFREVWIKGQGPKQTKKWYIKEKSDGTYEKITKAGFAKESWKIMIPLIKAHGGTKFASEVNYKHGGLNISIEMANRLSYILYALKESEGNYLLHEAMAKAARAMEKSLDNQIARMKK
jgi:hypothetical protein